MRKTIWSHSLRKVAVMADPMSNNGLTGLNFIEYDLRTKEKQEVSTDLHSFPVAEKIVPQWTPDEKSVLIKAERVEGSRLPGGIYKVDFSKHNTSEYMMLGYSWMTFQWKWKWLQFSPDGKTQYFASTDENLNLPMKLIARTIETSNEKIIRQFDKMPDKFFLSPDGNKIAVKYDNSLLVFNADGSNENVIRKDLDKNWGTLLGWSIDNKSVLVQKPGSKEGWSIWMQPLDGQDYREVISADKLKPFFGASGLMLHYVGGETYLSMQNGERIYELWAVDNIVQK
jgi:Tol biopolymer transport system component